MVRKKIITYNSKILVFSKIGRSCATKLFDKMIQSHLATICWDAIIVGYAKNGQFNDAKKIWTYAC